VAKRRQEGKILPEKMPLTIPYHFARYFTIKSDECFSILSLSEPLVERRAIERGAKLEIQKMNA
jgi:hypothetical protein